MHPAHLQQVLLRLDLTPVRAAGLLGVKPITVRRWLESEAMTGPAEQALAAWVKLHDAHMAWRPGSITIRDPMAAPPRLKPEDAIARGEKRGGPSILFKVDTQRRRAVFGTMAVTYLRLPDTDAYALGTFTRTDAEPDLSRDAKVLDDAEYCIALAIKRTQQAPNSERPRAVAALRGLATATRQHAVGVERPKQRRLEKLAARLDELASEAPTGRTVYADFDQVLGELHAGGFYPPMDLVKAVAEAMLA